MMITINSGNNMNTQNSFSTTPNPNTLAGFLRTTRAASLLPLLLLLTLPAAVQAQDYTYTTNDDNTITITEYTGSGGAVTIPDTINGLPVTSIGNAAFAYCSSLTNVTIPDSVTNIGDYAFSWCERLTNFTIPNSVTNIGYEAFYRCYSLSSVSIPNSVTSIGDYVFCYCHSLTNVTIGTNVTSIGTLAFNGCWSLINVTIPNSVTNIGGSGAFFGCHSLTNITIGNGVITIGDEAFDACTSLSSVTIPNSVTSIGYDAFYNCTNLTGVYFQGNAPSVGCCMFAHGEHVAVNATIYYLPGMTGWANFAQLTGLPTALWNPRAQTSDGSFGVRMNCFGFNIIGTSNLVVVVEACSLANSTWIPVGTNKLNTFVGTNGTSYFSDPQWTNYPVRCYRLRSP